MGWNYGYTMMEEHIIGMYDFLGEEGFTAEVAKIIMRPYISTDADSGGAIYLEAHDGKMMEQIVVEAVDPDFDPEAYIKKETSFEMNERDAYVERFFEVWRDRSFWE